MFFIVLPTQVSLEALARGGSSTGTYGMEGGIKKVPGLPDGESHDPTVISFESITDRRSHIDIQIDRWTAVYR